jgi:DMSO/TMAO reductase YedYZ molybdopterin-dependent catalytic subunit
LAAGVAVGFGELVAAFVGPAASPIVVVGNRVIALTPSSLKRWAISSFGTNDKPALLTGIYVIIAILALVAGALASRWLTVGQALFTAVATFGLYCALSAGGTDQLRDALPAVLAGLLGLITLTQLIARLPQPGTPTDRSGRELPRRRFLLASAGTAAGAAVVGFGGRYLIVRRYNATAARAAVRLPGPASPAPALPTGVDLGRGAAAFVTPNADFYRVDTALSLPQVNPNTWQLRIHGMVDRPITLTWDQLLARPLIERYITLCCVSNDVGGDLISSTRFLGARLADLLHEAGVHPGADQLRATSSDGMTIGAPTAVVLDGRDSMLAVGMNGVPLPIEHGFPVRMVVPGLYGYVSACKWIVDLEATTFASAPAYWVQEGYATAPPIELESRIDIPRSGAKVKAGKSIAIAGVAWDQHVGVSRVEVQVDDGPWTAARLAPVPSTDTWRQWVFPWTVPEPGHHLLRVRATDARGQLQTSATRPPFPAGATGWHTISVTSVAA